MENTASPILYIVAGPPGIGKTTNSPAFLPDFINVLNHDQIEADYKRMNIRDYSDRANQKMWELIHENIALDADFGLELNLGFDNHYEGLRKIHKLGEHYAIHVLLFFTDIYHLCLNRAAKREAAGGHVVEPANIEEMRYNTMPLFKKNISMFKHITLVDVTYNTVELVYSGYYSSHIHEFIQDPLPNWIVSNFPEITT